MAIFIQVALLAIITNSIIVVVIIIVIFSIPRWYAMNIITIRYSVFWSAEVITFSHPFPNSRSISASCAIFLNSTPAALASASPNNSPKNAIAMFSNVVSICVKKVITFKM